jgi:hypothetical protein
MAAHLDAARPESKALTADEQLEHIRNIEDEQEPHHASDHHDGVLFDRGARRHRNPGRNADRKLARGEARAQRI